MNRKLMSEKLMSENHAGKNRASKKRADELITLLELAPHPEGGFYREIHRSQNKIIPLSPLAGAHIGTPADLASSRKRDAITVMYFLLTEGQHSRWHQVDADEVWHYDEGDPLEQIWFIPGESHYQRQVLGPLIARSAPVRIVPAGAWQAARSLGSYTLAGCTVAPGFEFTGFRLLADHDEDAQALRAKWPELAEFL